MILDRISIGFSNVAVFFCDTKERNENFLEIIENFGVFVKKC